ncbi:MAG: hypothetical protein KDE53_03290 [Caldilineaceae bacterium]|nr:hypothetical protein [Caldilineaceae bacterium]
MYDQLTVPSILKRTQRPALIMAAGGVLLAVVGFFLDAAQFWQSYLLAFLFWLAMGLGCLGFVMLHHLAGGRWSALIRRIMETGAMTLPIMALLFLPLLFGLRTLYPWLNSEHVAASDLLQQKAAYLNLPFFLVRAVLYFGVWITLAALLNRWSVAEDNGGQAQVALRMRRLSAIGMLLYAITATFAAYDWMMSLEPEWFSSIYGLLFIAGQALAALALAIISLRYLGRANATTEAWTNQFNDLGNFLLGFVMIWAYFAFSQFLIIWSANIPEEALWYYHRSQGGWLQVGIFLIALHFVLPFFLLLSRPLKRKAHLLTVLAVLILVARVIDLYWLIVPAFHPEGLHLHWLDFVLLIAMGSGWYLIFARQWVRTAPVAHHDPHLVGVAHE